MKRKTIGDVFSTLLNKVLLEKRSSWILERQFNVKSQSNVFHYAEEFLFVLVFIFAMNSQGYTLTIGAGECVRLRGGVAGVDALIAGRKLLLDTAACK